MAHMTKQELKHDEMADFIRKQDPFRHLVTSSMGTGSAELGGKLRVTAVL